MDAQGAAGSAPTRPKTWPVWLGYVTAVVVPIVASVVIAVLIAVARGSAAIAAVLASPEFICAMLAVTAACNTAIALLFCGRDARFERLRLGRSQARPLQVALHALFALAVGFAAYGFTSLLIGEPSSAVALRRAIGAADWGWKIAILAFMTLLNPVSEELLFRGFMQSGFTRRWGPGVGLVLTSVLFGVAHLEPSYILFAAVLGFGLGWAADRTRSIRPAILAHVLNNALAGVPVALGADTQPDSGPSRLIVPMVALAIAGFVYFAIERWYPKTPAGQQAQIAQS